MQAVAITETSRQFWAALEYVFKRSDIPNQEALAITAGVSQPTISDLLNKKRAYRAPIQTKIARALGYDLVDFLLIGREILAGHKPNLTSPPKLPIDSLDAYQSKLLGELIKDRSIDLDLAVIDDVMYVADRNKTDFEAGQLYLVYLEGKRQVRTAVLLNGAPALAAADRCDHADTPWGPPQIIGQVMLKAVRV